MKTRILAAVIAALFILPALCVSAYADGAENPAGFTLPPPAPGTTQEIITIPQEMAADGVTLKVNADGVELETGTGPEPPVAPPGAGSVIENTENGGKEFFTIATEAENVFYLVVDREREAENVYFLKPVNEADLLSLSGMPPRPEPEAPAPAPVEPVTAPAPESGGNSMGMIVVVIVIVIVGGGAGSYFKIYRPKQQQADSGDEYEDEDEADIPDNYGDNDDYDSGDWYAGDADDPGGDGE
jgi:hypothetical protein